MTLGHTTTTNPSELTREDINLSATVAHVKVDPETREVSVLMLKDREHDRAGEVMTPGEYAYLYGTDLLEGFDAENLRWN